MRIHLIQTWSRPIAAAALAVAAVTGISACSPSEPTASSATSATGQHLAASDFSAALSEPGTIVLDVRTPAEFASGHLPQAKNIDIEGPDFATQIEALDKSAKYAVYCRTGNRSGTALEQMDAAGFTRAFDLADGIVAWQGMGGPIVTGG